PSEVVPRLLRRSLTIAPSHRASAATSPPPQAIPSHRHRDEPRRHRRMLSHMTESLARRERAALCDLAVEVGPDAPTLCEGWTASDLVAHLLVRERNPVASLGNIV